MAMLRETDFSGANLYEAILDYAILVETNLRQANLTGCSVCGLSAWNVHLEGANQENLVITSPLPTIRSPAPNGLSSYSFYSTCYH